MPIELKNVCARTRGTLSPVSLNKLTMRIEADRHVAILSTSKTRLNMLVDVICGANAPDSGSIVCDCKLSWPLPAAKFLHRHLTFVANARFIARLYEVDQRSFIDRVIDMAGIADLADEKLSYCPNTAISRFSFALGACLPFDTYLFTSTNVGEKEDYDRYNEVIAGLGQRSGLLLVTSSAKAAQPFCDTAYVLEESGAVYYDDIEAAIEHIERLAKKKPKDDDEESLPSQEEAVSDDFF